MRPSLSRAIGAGLVATALMTAIGMMAPAMGMPKMDVAAMLGSLFNNMQLPEPMTGVWWAGMVWHFLNGAVIFPLLYIYAIYPLVGGQDWVRGMVWGLVLWFLAQAMVMPMMGMGFFSSATPNPAMMVLGSLIGHALYGVTLGAIAGHQPSEAHGGHGRLGQAV